MSKFKVGDRVAAPKFYGDADYGGVGVITKRGCGDVWIVRFGVAEGGFHDEELAIVAMAAPVQQVTIKRIVRGDYGVIDIEDVFDNSVNIRAVGNYGISDLRRAAQMFKDIADALEESA